MKKVLVLVVAFSLLATSVFAVGIRNTKHDLSSAGLSGQGTVVSDNYTEVCVFCHTPHGGNTDELAPLWNRSNISATYAAGDLYNSATLESVSQPSQVFNAVNASDAKLCMSCHDGTSLNEGLYNPANSSGNVQPNFPGDDTVTANADIGGATGKDLTNDHPIGMDYATAASTDGELNSATTAGGKTYVVNAAVPLYPYSGYNVMWCSSCHDVHDNTYSPFLNVDNAGSALCTTCHIK